MLLGRYQPAPHVAERRGTPKSVFPATDQRRLPDRRGPVETDKEALTARPGRKPLLVSASRIRGISRRAQSPVLFALGSSGLRLLGGRGALGGRGSCRAFHAQPGRPRCADQPPVALWPAQQTLQPAEPLPASPPSPEKNSPGIPPRRCNAGGSNNAYWHGSYHAPRAAARRMGNQPTDRTGDPVHNPPRREANL